MHHLKKVAWLMKGFCILIISIHYEGFLFCKVNLTLCRAWQLTVQLNKFKYIKQSRNFRCCWNQSTANLITFTGLLNHKACIYQDFMKIVVKSITYHRLFTASSCLNRSKLVIKYKLTSEFSIYYDAFFTASFLFSPFLIQFLLMQLKLNLLKCLYDRYKKNSATTSQKSPLKTFPSNQFSA